MNAFLFTCSLTLKHFSVVGAISEKLLALVVKIGTIEIYHQFLNVWEFNFPLILVIYSYVL
jgi:hypothetical protein